MIGIYKITSPTNKVYIGQSIDIEKRFNKYKKLGCKKQTKLYCSFLSHGTDKHKFEILCECVRGELNNLEIYYINLYQTFNSEKGMNLRAGGSHGTHSEETRIKIGNAHRGKLVSNKARENMSKAQLNISDKISKRISERNKGNQYAKGRKLSLEEINNLKLSRIGMSPSMLGKKHSEEAKTKMSKAKIGKLVSKETAKKISVANKGRVMGEEWKDKIRKSRIGRKFPRK